MKFKTVKLEDKKVFDDFFKKYSPQISELTFTNIFSWRYSKRYEYCVKDDHLVIRFLDGNNLIYLQPIGNDPVSVIRNILLSDSNISFQRVEEKIALLLKKEFNVVEDRDNFDYVYSMDELRKHEGGKFITKRNFIKRIEKLNPDVCGLSDETVKDFMLLQERWCDIKRCREDPSLFSEDCAIHEALRHYKELGIIGVCVKIDERIAGFAIGERFNKDTFVEHFEKGDNEFNGIYQYVLYKFVEMIPDSYKFLNREQDLGISGIRKAKKSYHPLKMVKKYSIRNK